MKPETYNFLLALVQYITIVTSGTLGIMGLYFDFKNKKTGRLTKSGIIACTILILSLILGLGSKTIELKLQRDKDDNDAAKTRQTLKISTNVERILTPVKNVVARTSFSISLDSPVFKDYKAAIEKRFGLGDDDHDFTLRQLIELFPNDSKWKAIATDLFNLSPVVEVHSTGEFFSGCVIPKIDSILQDDPDSTRIKFELPFKATSIDYHSGLLAIEAVDTVKARKRPQLMSLLDFENATIIIYMAEPHSWTQTSKDKYPVLHYRKSLALKYDDAGIRFNFDDNKFLDVRHFQLKADTCSKYPYFIDHTQSIY